jgi:hypothetical protein
MCQSQRQDGQNCSIFGAVVAIPFILKLRFCENLFAAGFDMSDAQHLLTRPRPFEVITAFEVFEHLANPIAEITRMLQLAPAIFFSTFVVPDPAPAIGSWCYYVLDHGQHIAFYTIRSLEALAKTFGLQLYTNGESLHLLTYSKIPGLFFRLAVSSPFLRLASLIFRRESLLFKIRERLLVCSKQLCCEFE